MSVVSHRKYFTEDRVYFFDKAGRYRSNPAQFTDLAPQDPFVAVSASLSCPQLPEHFNEFEQICDPEMRPACYSGIIMFRQWIVVGIGGAGAREDTLLE